MVRISVLYPDIPNYTNIQPQMRISEIIG